MGAKRNILFLLIDCLRADMCFGDDRFVTTPTIDRLKENGTAFTQAISVSAATQATVSTMLTGVYPFLHGIMLKHHGRGRFGILNPKCVTLPEILRENGYHTYAMVTGPLFPHLGLDRGFEHYSQRETRYNIYSDWGRQLEKSLRDRTLEEPWFLFLHLWEIHMPRVVLRPFKSKRYGRSRYERALSCLDHHVQRFLDLIDFDRTIVFVHGDHGENYDYPPPVLRPFFTRPGNVVNKRFGILRKLRRLRKQSWDPHQPKAHLRWVSHGDFLYEFLARIPLIAVGAGIFPEAMIVDSQVSQIDIMPTILDAVGLADRLTQRIHGRSLLPLVRRESLPERSVILQTRQRMAVRTPRWKLIITASDPGLPELYDLENDPSEDNNLWEVERDVARMLEEELRDIESLKYPELLAEPSVMSEEDSRLVEKRLRDLGYL